jgi:hypothetical protein
MREEKMSLQTRRRQTTQKKKREAHSVSVVSGISEASHCKDTLGKWRDEEEEKQTQDRNSLQRQLRSRERPRDNRSPSTHF